MLRCLLGRTKSGKTQNIYREIGRQIKVQNEKAIGEKTDSLFLVVPEQYTLQGERDLIDSLKLNGLIDVEVLSFKRIMHRIFLEKGFPQHIDLNSIGKMMILKKVFNESRDELTIFKKASHKKGFISMFSDTISELKLAMIETKDIDSAIDALEENKLLKSKLTDIRTIYENYNKYIDRGFYDEEDKYMYLLELLDQESFIDDSYIWIDGFDNFSKIEYKIIEKLALKSKILTMAITTDCSTDNESFDHTNKIMNIIDKYDFESPNFVEKYMIKDHIKNKEINHLEDNLFKFNYKKYKETPENVSIFSGSNRYAEIEYLASIIMRRVREDKLSWKDIAVVTNDLTTYELLVKRIFDQYDIPYFVDNKVNISDNPLVRVVLSALDSIIYGYKAKDLLNLAKSGLLQVNRDELASFENYCNERGIKGNKFKSEFTKNIVKFGQEKYDLVKLNITRRKITDNLIVLEEKIKDDDKTSKNIGKYLYEYLQEESIYQSIQKEINVFILENDKINAQRYSQVWNLFMKILDQFSEIMGDDIVSLKEFRDILDTGISEQKIGVIPEDSNRVLIGNLERSKSHQIRDLFVIGINDGILPKKGSDKEILIDLEKTELIEKGIEMFSNIDIFVERENFSIYSTFCKASDKLYLSYPLLDYESKNLRPSSLIDRVMRIFPNIEINSDMKEERREIPITVNTAKSTYKHLIEKLRYSMDGNEINQIWWEVLSWYKEYGKEKYEDLLSGLFYDNKIPDIEKEYIKGLYSADFKTSVTAIETFKDCPFKYFVSYGLKPIVDKSYNIEFFDMGNLFHKALEEYCKEIHIDEWKNISERQCYKIVDLIVDEIIVGYVTDIFLSNHSYGYLVKKLRRVSKSAIWNMTKQIQKGEFLPKEFELSFKKGTNQVPIVVELSNGQEITLSGTIDRVDVLEDAENKYVRIIDYKSGMKKFSLSDVYNGLQMQLVVYLIACMKNKDYFNASKIMPGGVFYYRIDDPFIETTEIDQEKLKEKIANEMKMDGLVISDLNIIEKMDEDIVKNNESNVVPVKIKKNGDFTKTSKIADLEDFDRITKKAMDNIIDAGDKILSGVIEASPIKRANGSTCSYCSYKGICQFDVKFTSNNYRKIEEYNHEEVIKKLREEYKELDEDA